MKPEASTWAGCIDLRQFRLDWGVNFDDVYQLVVRLSYSEGEIDEDTFLKYGIITATTPGEAIRKYWTKELQAVI